MQIEVNDKPIEAPALAKIVRESDFHSELQQATISGDKSEFNLILSMLTDKAEEFDEFNLPASPNLTDTSELHKKFYISEKKMYGKGDPAKSLYQNDCIHQNQMADVKLDLQLNPESLVQEQYDLPSNVYDNMHFNARSRLLNQSAREELEAATEVSDNLVELAKYKEIDVESWFNVLQQARALSALA